MKTTNTTNRKYWVFLSEIQGRIAMWGIRQSPYHCPDDLAIVIKAFRAAVVRRFDQHEMARLDRLELRSLLKQYLEPIPEFQKWNERKNGNQSPYAFVDRYSKPDPDDDFIDLGALMRNVEVDIFREAERDRQFDEESDLRSRRWHVRLKMWWRRTFPKKCLPINPQSPVARFGSS